MVDLALSEQRGITVLHLADCPRVRALAAVGVPVITLLDCVTLPERAPDWDLVRCACLDGVKL